VLSQEALTTPVLDVLSAHLGLQERWSELPLILLLDRDVRIAPVAARLRASLDGAKLVFLQRPVRAIELLSAVQTAVAARRRQLQLRDHIEFQEELRRELIHRVKNALANVMAIYHMTKRQSETFEAFTEAFEGRLAALSRVHSALVATDESSDIRDLAETVLAPYRSDDRRRLAIDGPAAKLAPASAVAFALCLHELATNASKYGAFSSPDGRVELKWWLEQGMTDFIATIEWIECGGPAVIAPTRRGYGTAFIEASVKGSMQGTVTFEYRPPGLRCVFRVGVEAAAPATVARTAA
jgi:two-component sensor histidine kinase